MATSPRFRFPVYQIDFSAVQAGKRVASSKRRIRWRFGFPNLQALDAGRTGTDCRGEEHEIVVIWSITSGKRQILMDGKEIHYSSTRISLLDHSWSTKGNHVLKVIGHASPPISIPPGFRQYDLLIDGQSFFTMPKMYELGIKSTADNRIPGLTRGGGSGEYDYSNGGGGGDYGGGYGGPVVAAAAAPYGSGYRGGYDSDPPVHAPRTPQEEEEELQRAIQASLAESRRHLGEAAPPQKQTQAPAPPPPPEQPPVDLMESTLATSDLLDIGGGGGGGGSAPSYGGGGYETYGAPAPPPPPQQHYQPPPPSQYGGYGAPPPPQQQQQYLALPSSSGPPPPPMPPAASMPPQQQYGEPSYGGGYGAPPPQPQPPVASFSSPAPSGYGGSVGGGGYSSGLSVDPYAGYANEDPFAPKPPSHNEIANDILKAYSTPTAAGQYQPGVPFDGTTNGYGNGSDDAATTLSMNRLTLAEQENGGGNGASSSKPKSALEQAMSKLVNLDHIDEPAEEQLKLTMKQKEDEERKKADKKSKPLPPAAKGMVGSAATLSQIQEVKPKLPPKELVMKPPAGLFTGDAAMAGALVVHGSALTTPPPLQQRGVGVVHMQGQYPSAHVAASMGMGYGPPQQPQQPMMMQQQQQYQQPPPPQPQQQQMMYGQQQQPMMMQTGYGQAPPPQPMPQYQPPPAGYGAAGGWR